MARDLHLHRRTRPRRAHQDPGRAGRRPSATPPATAARSRRLARVRPTDHPLGGNRTRRLRQQGQPGQGLRAVLRHQPGLHDETELVEWGVTAITRYDPLRPRDPGRQPQRHLPHRRVRPVADGHLRRERHRPRPRAMAAPGTPRAAPAQLGADEARRRHQGRRPRQHARPVRISTPLAGCSAPSPTTARRQRTQYSPPCSPSTSRASALATTDALGRAVLTQDYDMAGAEIHQQQRRRRASAGCSLTPAVSSCRPGTAAASADQRRLRRTPPPDRRSSVDERHRRRRLAEQIDLRRDARRRPTPRRRNLRGALYQHYDEAGLATTVAAGLQGQHPDRHPPAPRRLHAATSTGRQSPASTPTQMFTTTTAYDALNRRHRPPPPTAASPHPAYNERSLLAAVTVTLPGAAATDRLRHQRHLQRQGPAPDHRLRQRRRHHLHLRPRDVPAHRPDTTRPQRRRSPLQDLSATPTTPSATSPGLADAAQQTIFFNNQVVTPSADYTYDPIYRLTGATGREHSSARPPSRSPPGTTPPGSTCRCPPTARPCATTPRTTPTTRSATSRSASPTAAARRRKLDPHLRLRRTQHTRPPTTS